MFPKQIFFRGLADNLQICFDHRWYKCIWYVLAMASIQLMFAAQLHREEGADIIKP